MDSELKVTLTASMRIQKYGVGVNPDEGEPFEIVEREIVLTGKEAEEALKQLNGGDTNGTN